MSNFIKAIGDVCTFAVQISNPGTSADADADALPTYRVYEDNTNTPIQTGTMALLDDANTLGWYYGQLTLSLANGYERLKDYKIRITAIVGGVTGSMWHELHIGRITDEDLGILERGQAVAMGTNTIQYKSGTIGAKAGQMTYLDSACTTLASRYLMNEVSSYNSGTETGTLDPAWTGGTPAGTIQYRIMAGPPALITDPPDMDITTAAVLKFLNTALSSGSLAAGTVGKALVDAAVAATDPLTAVVPGAYGSTTAGYAIGTTLADILLILAKANLITGDGAGNILANIKRINGVTINGDGAATPMGT